MVRRGEFIGAIGFVLQGQNHTLGQQIKNLQTSKTKRSSNNNR